MIYIQWELESKKLMERLWRRMLGAMERCYGHAGYDG